MSPSVEKTQRSPEGPSAVGIVGRGRVGTALAAALRDAGVVVDGPAERGEIPTGEAIVLCVPDSEIETAAATVAGGAPFVGHVSGATPLAALIHSGQPGFGLHPLQTFAQGAGPEAFRGVGCAIAGSDPDALAVAEGLARRLGMTPFEIEESGRAAYHAAASVASNYLVALQHTAEELASAAGLGPEEARALMAPLVRQTVENWAAQGPEAALTGPVARGDHATVERQRAAVAEAAPHLLSLFDELTERTRCIGRVPA